MTWKSLCLSALILVVLITSPARAQWQPDGTPVCAATGAQTLPYAIVSDGAGGAIIAWEDRRSGNVNHLYAQRINAYGVAQWTIDGVPLSTVAGQKDYLVIATDGAGGAIVAWNERRFPSPFYFDVVAQRINADGVVQWVANGVDVCNATGDQEAPTIVSDGAGGAIVAWDDSRAGTRVYLQRLNSAGVPQWTPNGISACTVPTYQATTALVPDDLGGAIVAWQDGRDMYGDIYAQRIDAAGVLQWSTSGVAVCTLNVLQQAPSGIRDGAGGAIVAWLDARNGTHDIYAQRIDGAGVTQWTADGNAVSTGLNGVFEYSMSRGDDGDAIVVWGGGSGDIVAQRLDGSGVGQWTPDGIVLGAGADGAYPKAVTDGSNGTIVTWEDYRNFYPDIYGQRIDAAGSEVWTAGGVPVCDDADSQYWPLIVASTAGTAIVAWEDDRNGNSDMYALRIPEGVTGVGDAPSIRPLTVLSIQPNPFANVTEIQFELAVPSDVSIGVFDVQGRRVYSKEMQSVPAGWRHVSFAAVDNQGLQLPSGVYFCRVTAAGTTLGRKMVVVR